MVASSCAPPNPGLNQVLLHARQNGLAVVQAKRIEDRIGIATTPSGNFVGLLRSIGATQFDRHPPFHSRRPVFQATKVSTPMFGTVLPYPKRNMNG